MLVIFLSLSFTSLVSYTSAKNALQKSILSGLHAISEFKEGELYLYLEGIKARTIDFSSDGFIREKLDVINKKSSKKAAKELTRHLLRNKMVLAKNIIQIDIVDLTGNIVASTNTRVINTAVSQPKNYEKGKKEAWFSDIYMTKEKVQQISVYAPLALVSNSKEVIGVIVNHYLAQDVSDILSGSFIVQLGAKTQLAGIGKTGETYIVNQDKLMASESQFIEKASLRQVVDTDPVENCLSDSEEIVGIWDDYRGVPVIGSSMCIQMSGFKWVLIAEQDVSEAFHSIFGMRSLLFFLGVITLLIVFVVILAISKSISQPIVDLRESAEKISHGDLSIKAAKDTNDEVGELSRSFDIMTENLIKEESRFQYAINNMNDGLVYTDSDFNILIINPVAKEMLEIVTPLGGHENLLNVLEVFETDMNVKALRALKKDMKFDLRLSRENIYYAIQANRITNKEG